VDHDLESVEHVGHLPLPAQLGVDEVAPDGREGDVDLELAGATGRLGVEVGEGVEVVAGDDDVHPRLVAAGDVGDRQAGLGVDDTDGRA
jgi:hypothetical protein